MTYTGMADLGFEAFVDTATPELEYSICVGAWANPGYMMHGAGTTKAQFLPFGAGLVKVLGS